MLKGLKLNVTDATFENGDKTALFEFSHPATEQTPALTDYRYIGHMPNNYVKFNCDSDGTNCEIWRIIGVFSVDDGDGNYQQRIKLVRGSAFSEEMQWDDRDAEGYEEGNGYGKNDWNGAKLNIFLNGDYLTRQGDASTYGLKALAQSQIDDAKYYLGALSDVFRSTEEMYDFERGINTFNYENYCLNNTWDTEKCSSNYCEYNPANEICNATRASSWEGKISIIYPTDYAYIYSKGVEDECFNQPLMCYYWEPTDPTETGNYNHPEAGWLYNSNNLDGQSIISNNWLLTTSSDVSYHVFGVGLDGGIGYVYGGSSANNLGVRPVVYLKPSINIISGEGTEQNPYILG